MQLSLVELIGALLVDKIRTKIELERLERLTTDDHAEGKGEVRIILEAYANLAELYGTTPTGSTPQSASPQTAKAALPGRSRRSDPAGQDVVGAAQEVNGRNGRKRSDRQTPKRRVGPRQRSYSVDETGEGSSDEKEKEGMEEEVTEDEMIRLERKRGGSPARLSTIPVTHGVQKRKGATPARASDNGDSLSHHGNVRDARSKENGHSHLTRSTNKGKGKALPQGRYSFERANALADGTDIWDPPTEAEDEQTAGERQQNDQHHCHHMVSGKNAHVQRSEANKDRRGSLRSDRRRRAAEMADEAVEHAHALAVDHGLEAASWESKGPETGRSGIPGRRGENDVDEYNDGNSGKDNDHEEDNDHEHNDPVPGIEYSDDRSHDHDHPHRRSTSEQPSTDDLLAMAQETAAVAADAVIDTATDLKDLLLPVKMRSEQAGDWWMYYSVLAAVIGALVMSWMPF